GHGTGSGDLRVDRPDPRCPHHGDEPRRRRRRLHSRFSSRHSRNRAGVGMNTVLIVTSDEALRARLVSALSDHAVFAAPTDAEALKTLRLIEIDVVLR